MKKSLIVSGLVAGIALSGATGAAVVNAASGSSASSTNPMSSLVDAVASKFNLNRSEVQAVFDEQRTKMEAARETEIKKEVAQLVTDGKITQAQADKINAKRAELKAERESMTKDTSKTREEMKSEMDAKRTDLETWAKDNDLDTEYLRYVMGGVRGHGPGGFGGPRSESSSTSSSSASTSSSN